MRIFMEKIVKIALASPRTPVGLRQLGLRPQTPTLLLPPIVTTLSSLALNVFYYLQK